MAQRLKVTREVYNAIKAMFKDDPKLTLAKVREVAPYGVTTLSLIKKSTSFAHYKRLRYEASTNVESVKNSQTVKRLKLKSNAADELSKRVVQLKGELAQTQARLEDEKMFSEVLSENISAVRSAGFFKRLKYILTGKIAF